MKTTLHYYRFDKSKPGQLKAYKKLKAETLDLIGFKAWGTDYGNHRISDAKHSQFMAEMKKLDGRLVTLETEHLFVNQWNSAEGFRLFNWSEYRYPNRDIIAGYYLEQTQQMYDTLRSVSKCGYCGKQEASAKGYVFCPHCLDSEYLQADQLHLTRMVPVCDNDKPRAKLTDEESAVLIPLYRDAQRNGNTARGKARIAKRRADITATYKKTLRIAKIKRDVATWILDNVPEAYENWIYYDHTGRHAFGWREPVSADVLSLLLDAVSEFPGEYDIKCQDGRTLSN